MKLTIAILACLFANALSPLRAAGAAPSVTAPVMPRVGDYTHMWWAEGFPSNTPSAPWVRCIQTGYYAMALDTDALRIPHFGAALTGVGYVSASRQDNSAWQKLPPAQLSLSIIANRKTFRCKRGGRWTNFTGPRLIESGRFFQRADVTDLVFTADDGERLNAEGRFETAAWPDRLGLIFAVRPGLQPITAGDAVFGRVGGGFGLDGTNHLEIPHSFELDTEQFTLELWAFVPSDYQVSGQTFPWLVCKNNHEEAEGNYGIVILNGRAQARMNIGGGRDNAFVVDAHPSSPLRTEAWNHLTMSYDGDTLRLYVNGEVAGETKVGRKRVPGHDGLAFGRRQDNCGDGYHFRGVIDEIRFYNRALTPVEVRERVTKPEAALASAKPVRAWSFRADGATSLVRPTAQWKNASMEISLATPKGTLHQRLDLPVDGTLTDREWHEVNLALDPVRFAAIPLYDVVKVQASEIPGGSVRPVVYEAARGWHRVNLDGIVPIVPFGSKDRQNDAMERVKLVLANPSDQEQTARLLFEKSESGFRHNFGSPITGMSAILRDMDGNPTGIPVQLSKDWHSRPEGGMYQGLWFHGISQVHLPARTNVELELTIVYGHWGGVAAATHTQLCLIGWGSNQLWDESALGSWGESICYEPDQAQAQATVMDVRPVMVRSMANDQSWSWTHNVGGGDFFRMFGTSGQRVFPRRMRTTYERQGPCLTEVTYAGHTGDIEHAATVSLARTDDVVRGTYRLRLDVKKAVDFSRFVILQIGADTYSYTGERKMAVGNEAGMSREWNTQWGGDAYRTKPVECVGRMPWVSLHEAVARIPANEKGAWANRGIVVRSWNARLGGKKVAPWVAEHGANIRETEASTIDFVPPPGVTRLLPGDFIEATMEHIIVPQFAKDYYGPNEALRTTLTQWQNTWHMIAREASGDDRRVTVKSGTLERLYPDIRIRTDKNRAEYTVVGGLGYVPITFTGLTSPKGVALTIDGIRLNQSVHGNDFWQTDYDALSRTWSRTYNVPVSDNKKHLVQLVRMP